MNKILKYIPTYCVNSVYDIDFSKLYELGKRIILTDLDNTLISYRINEAPVKLKELNSKLKKIGFSIFVVSNNNDGRIVEFSKSFCLDGYLTKAGKPKANKINNFILEQNFKKEEIIFIGDQLVTDIKAANNANLDSILVKTIDTKSQKWYTKINRLREKKIIREIIKYDSLIGNTIKNVVNQGEKDE